MNNRWRTVFALLFLLALTIGIYWPLTIGHDLTWLENPDQANQIRPWFDYEARELHAGRIPLWDPYLWSGQSLIAQVLPGVVNPINWVLFAMPLQDGHISVTALHWYWALIHWLAAVLAFWLCRDLKCGFIGSVLGGSVFAFTGFLGHSLTPQFLMSALAVPVVLLFFARVVRGHRPWSSAALTGVAMGFAFFSGHHNIPIYTVVVLGGLWLWHVLSAGNPLSRAAAIRIAQAALFLAVWLSVSAVQSMPTVEYGRQSVRWAGAGEPQTWHEKVPYSVHAQFSLPAKALAGMVIPDMGQHADPFVGTVAFTLALAALILKWRDQSVRLLAFAAVLATLMALGPDTPVHRLAYNFIPMVDKARYPAFAFVIAQAAIAALAALGLEAWRAGGRSKIVIAWPIIFAFSTFSAYSTHRFQFQPSIQILAAVGLVLGAALLLMGRPRFLPALATALLLVEIQVHPAHFDRRDRPGAIGKMMADQADIAAFLKQQPGWFRVDTESDVVPYNFGDWFGIEQFGGYTASMPVRINRMNGPLESAARLGIRYHVGRNPYRDAQQLVFESRSGLKVFEAPGITQPLRAVHDQPCGGEDRFHIVERVSNTFIVDADLACPGIVVTGDPWYQGWRASVDGGRVRIRDFDGLVRAVDAGAGHHRIEFRYRPASVYYGAVLTILGLALTAFVCARERRLAV